MRPILKISLQILSVVAILGAGLAISWRFQNSGPTAAKKPSVVSAREVSTQVPQPSEVRLNIPLQGRLVAFESVLVIAEVTGVFERSAHRFKVGVGYHKGELLARINDTEARYTLLAQKSGLAKLLAQAMPELKIDYSETFPAWEAYLRNFNPERTLPELPPVSTDAARYFLNAKDIYNQYYSIKAAEERLSKYSLVAPFTGVLTEVSSTVGALVRSGQPLATLTASIYEMAASVPVRDLPYLPIGARAKLEGPNGEAYTAKVSRVSTQIDPNTQAATVYLDVSGPGLREGLYLQGDVQGAEIKDVVELDQRLLVGENELYTVSDSILTRVPVEVVRRSGERVYVRGIPANTPIVIESVTGAYDGMKVKVRS